MTLQPLKVDRLYKQISNMLIAAIKEGQFKIGEALPSERDLAQRLNVSRSSVREALIALEIAGWIDIRTGNGVFVLRSDEPESLGMTDDTSVEDLLETREVLESEIARIAAERRTPEQLKELAAELQEMKRIAKNNDEFRQHDRRFHMLLGEMTGNMVLLELIEAIWNKRHRPMHRHFESHFGKTTPYGRLVGDHLAIYEAIAKADAEGAKKAMMHHLQYVRAEFFNNPAASAGE